MNPNVSSRRTLAFTLVEMLTVIAVIAILAALLLPVLNKSEGRAKRLVCINGLEQIGLAFHTFSNDHNGKFPMAISTNDGGSMEYVQSGFQEGGEFFTSCHQFQTLSNELVFPRTLVCPSDTRVMTNDFALLENVSLSYFVGVQSTFDKPYTVLAGDRNLAGNSVKQLTILQLGPLSRLGWTWELHQFKGNVVFADGHVEQWNNAALATAESSSPFNQSLFLPSVVAGSELQFANGPSGSGGSGSSGSGGSGASTGSSGPAASGSTPTYPNSTSSGQSEPSPSSPSDANTASSSSQAPPTPTGQPMPSLSSSSGAQFYATETVSQAEAPDSKVVATKKPSPPSANTDAVVVAVQDPNAAMSQFDRHMTMVMQNSLEWFYILLCILVLLYLLNRLRKRLREKYEQENK
jgi:prepilin-type processing-associated H-X9-DG protein/prepilin-type N-terminal cleavage/methylation domain-containing protein